MPQLLSTLIVAPRLRKQRFYCAIGLFIAILLFGSIPGARAEIGRVGSGVVLHLAAYAVLTLLLFTGVEGSRKERALKAMFGAMLMGAIDELVQSMLPYRVGAVLDWVIDATAATVTAWLLWAFLPESHTPLQV